MQIKIYIYIISHASGHIESRPHWTPLFPTGTGTFLGVWGNHPSDFQGIFQDGWIICSGIPHRKLTWHFFSSTVWRCISLLTNGNLPKNHVSLSEGIKQWICSSNPLHANRCWNLAALKKPEVSGGKRFVFFQICRFFWDHCARYRWSTEITWVICRISSR